MFKFRKSVWHRRLWFRVNAIVCANDEQGNYAENCYSKEGLASLGLANNSELVTEKELQSGEIAWRLNEEKAGIWKQNIGVNNYPYFSGNPVYKLSDGSYGAICDHTYSTNKPTCLESAVCSVCNNSISALGHSFINYVSNDDATCEKNGTETANCERCDETDTRIVEDSALGHQWGEWTVIKEATTSTTGEKERVCECCDTKETEVIPMIFNEDTSKPSDEQKSNDNENTTKPSSSEKNNTDKMNSPKTGDNTNLGLYISLLAMSGFFIVILAVLRKKKVFGHK